MIKFLRLPTDGSEMDSPDPPMRRGDHTRTVSLRPVVYSSLGLRARDLGMAGRGGGMVRAPSSGIEWCVREEGTDCRGEGSCLCGSVQAYC